jgi:hypothetical protein
MYTRNGTVQIEHCREVDMRHLRKDLRCEVLSLIVYLHGIVLLR